MDNEKEIELIKERLNKIEKQYSQKKRINTLLKFIIGFIIVVFVLMFAIGVLQFISA